MSERDRKHLRLAQSVADIFSKDPNTRVGAVVLGAEPNELAIGFNGLPPGMADDDRLLNREWKNAHVRHAEANALSNVRGFKPRTIYATHFPCPQCSLAILAARSIRRVVTFRPYGEFALRWCDPIAASRLIFAEAGVEVVEAEEFPHAR